MLTKMNAAFKKKNKTEHWYHKMDATPDLPFITSVMFEAAS